MRNWKPVAALAIAALAVGTTATTAHAQQTDATVATFTLTAPGSLGITVPVGTTTTPVSLGTATADVGTFAPTLGAVTVVDDRAALLANWTATATGTHFDLQTAGADPVGDANQRVNNTAILYTATPTAAVGSLDAVTPPSGTLAAGALTVYAGSGSNEVTWDPTLTMTILPTQVAGTYQGTITHSVS